MDLERRVAFAEARASAAEEAAKFAVAAIGSAHVAIAWMSACLAAAGAGLAWWAAYYYRVAEASTGRRRPSLTSRPVDMPITPTAQR